MEALKLLEEQESTLADMAAYIGFRKPMPDIDSIKRALQKHGGNKTKAAEALGISRHAILRRVGTEQEPVNKRRHLVIPDTQVKPGVPLDHLTWAGKYVADKRPEVIVCLGDFADLPSLSTHEKAGSRKVEGRRYMADIESVHRGMELLMQEFVSIPGYKPELYMILGNHEDRITRYIDANPTLEGFMSLDDLGYEAWGWEVIPYKQLKKIDGIAYSHFFYNPNTGKPYGGTAHNKLKNIGLTFTMGHQQGKDLAERELSDGTMQRGLVVGSFYQHDEDYKGPQSNHHWRGIIMKHEVKDGQYDLMEVSLDYLRRRYG